MKVVILALTGPGGILDYGLAVASGLAEDNEVTVISSTETSVPRVHVRYISRAHWYRSSLIQEVRRRILQEAPDVVHDVVGSADLKSAFLVCRLRLTRIPIIVSLHDPVPHSGIPYSHRVAHSVLTRALVSRVEAVVTHGKTSLRIVERRFHPRRAVAVPLPVVMRKANADGLGDGRTVLFFGTLRWNKGPDRLLTIASRVWSTVPQARFIVAGSFPKGAFGTQWRILRAVRQMQRHPGFDVRIGFVPPEAVEKLFDRASVVVLPYRDATQSGVLGLAAAYGKCVVATAVGDIPDVVTHGQTGLLAYTNSEAELADLIVWALNNPSKASELGRALQDFARVHFSPRAVARRLCEIYAACLTPRRLAAGEARTGP